MYIKYTGKVFSFRALEGGQDATATVAVRTHTFYRPPLPTANSPANCHFLLQTPFLNLEP